MGIVQNGCEHVPLHQTPVIFRPVLDAILRPSYLGVVTNEELYRTKHHDPFKIALIVRNIRSQHDQKRQHDGTRAKANGSRL